jgi:hypothetical protein
MDTPSILLAIRPQPYQGQQLLGEKWGPFIDGLRGLLKQSGFEDEDSTEALLLFNFTHPHPAITTVLSYISKARLNLNEQRQGEPLPIQIIVHLVQDDETNNAFRNPAAGVWELLPPEAIHISRQLKASWDQLMVQKPLSPCTFSNEGNGLFKLEFAAGSDAIKTELLLPSRALPLQGRGKPCFYCGMQSHLPMQCPSKFLTMEHNGLASIGYLPFEQIGKTCQLVFSNPAAMTKVLSTGISPSQLRKSPGLIAFVGFFDVTRVYQYRFLWNITFSRYSKWQAVFNPEQLQLDNKNLQLGLDCLRVGKYEQAEEFLQREYQAKSSRRFFAAIGMAFLTLEHRGLAEMRSYLELAKSMTSQPKERIYVDLLLSRFYELIGETRKAKDALKSILTAKVDCPDAPYRKLQIEAKGTFSAEDSQILRSLIIDQRTLFMATLLDPAFLPVEAKVEDLLSTQYNTAFSRAHDFLAQASNEISDLSLWFDNQDQKLEANRAALGNLQQRLDRKSYFDVLDVVHKAKTLAENSRQLRESKLNELYDQINKDKITLGSYHDFWAGYRYQIFFKEFVLRLSPVEKALHEASVLAKKNEGMAYHKAIELLLEAEGTLESLKPLQVKMNGACLLCDSAISFSKKLAMTEIGGFVLATALVLGLGQLSDGHELGGLVGLANDPLFQKKATILTAVLIAPLVSLSWTISEQLRS